MADARAWAAASALALPSLLAVAWAAWSGRLADCWASLTRTEPLPIPHVTAEDRAAELVRMATASPGGRFEFGRVAVVRLGERGPYRVYIRQASFLVLTPDGAKRALAHGLGGGR